MNIANINTMIDTFIQLDKAPLPEHPNKGFNMADISFTPQQYTQHSCGAAACVMGWSLLLFGRMYAFDLEFRMGGEALYYPSSKSGCRHDYGSDPEVFTLRAAIRVLQILRDTGKVDWNEAIKSPWSPDSDADASPSFSADDWLDAILGNSDGMAVPLLEGPKRKESTFNIGCKKEVNYG